MKRHFFYFTVVFILVALAFGPRPAHAGNAVVGNGTPASCTEAALQAALGAATTGGGLVTFDCGQSAATPVTILLSQRLALPNGVIIDGGDREALILSAGDDPNAGAANGIGIFAIDAGVTAQLRNLKLLAAGDSAILNHGALTLADVEVQGARAHQCAGIESDGQLTLLGASTITTNAAETVGGGVCVLGGAAVLAAADIRYNSAAQGGGLYLAPGAVADSSDSYFTGNTTTGAGAAIYVGPDARLNSNSDALVQNVAAPASAGGLGGGLYNAGEATLFADVIAQNEAYDGGGIYNSGTLVVQRSDVQQNNATAAGGGLYNAAQAVYAGNSLVQNRADRGAGFYSSSAITVTNATISDNSGAISGNEVADGSAAIRYSSLYSNTATSLVASGGATTVLGSIIDDCAANGGGITSQGHNLDAGVSCGFGQGSDLSADPLLGPLTQTEPDRFTWHLLPADGSPAIDGGQATCQETENEDQHGRVRPAGSACDIGAVEVGANLPEPIVCGGVFTATADATLNSAQPDSALGGETTLQIGRQGGSQQVALLAFDLGQRLPPNQTIYAAELQLTVSRPPSASPYQLEVLEPATAWDEATLTWATQPMTTTSYGEQNHWLETDVARVDVTPLLIRWATGAITPTGILVAAAGADFDVQFSSREAGANPPRLVVQCGPAVQALAVDDDAADQQQDAALARLEQTSAVTVTVQLEAGVVNHLTFDLTPPAGVPADPLARAEWFLGEYDALLRLDDPATSLQLIRRSPDGLQLAFRQLHHEIPVDPAGLVISLDPASVVGFAGNYAPAITLPMTPTVSLANAEAVALAANGPAAELIGDTQLRYFAPGLLGIEPAAVRLAWLVHLRDEMVASSVYVDAHTGAVLVSLPRQAQELEIDLQDGKNRSIFEMCVFSNDIDFRSQPPESVNAYTNFTTVYNFWRNVFNRDSYDDDGEEIQVDIHANFGIGGVNAQYTNAPCDAFQFADGMTTLDIVGHEFTHAVNSSESGLEYFAQSGALDESLADIFGHFVDNSNWLHGEGGATARMPNPAIAGCVQTASSRNLSNPPCRDHPDHMLASVSGDGVGFRGVLPGVPADQNPDYAYVHSNSGILNKAAFLLVEGGVFGGYTVRGIGETKARLLFYNVVTGRLWSSARFLSMRNAAVDAARSFALFTELPFPGFSGYGFTAADVCSVRNAYGAVGLGWGDANCDGIEDAPNLPDPDGDGVPSPPDNCPTTPNPTQADADKDRIGDVCDPDQDNDRVPNAVDNCPLAANPGREDWNSNGVGDACEDSDRDGWLDFKDNCKGVPNADQLDYDLDKVGNACDWDMDNDTIANQIDNCPYESNKSQRDRSETLLGVEADGVGDACDLCPADFSPGNGDLDGDGIGDVCDGDIDGDDVANDDDNCRLNYNPDQFNPDRDLYGAACDDDDFANILNQPWEVIVVDGFERFPVPVCANCPAAPYLAPGFESVVNVQLPPAYQARIIDTEGTVVSKGQVNGATQTLRFNPAPYARAGFAGSQQTAYNASLGAAAVNRTEADMTRYYLQIIPPQGQPPVQPLRVGGTLIEQIEVATPRLVYLPLVTR